MRTEGAEDSVAWSLGDAHVCLPEGMVVAGERGSRGATLEAGIEGPSSQDFEPWRKPSLPTGAVGRGPSTPPSLADPAALWLMSPDSRSVP